MTKHPPAASRLCLCKGQVPRRLAFVLYGGRPSLVLCEGSTALRIACFVWRTIIAFFLPLARALCKKVREGSKQKDSLFFLFARLCPTIHSLHESRWTGLVARPIAIELVVEAGLRLLVAH